MDRPSTPPQAKTVNPSKPIASPPTPEITRRIVSQPLGERIVLIAFNTCELYSNYSVIYRKKIDSELRHYVNSMSPPLVQLAHPPSLALHLASLPPIMRKSRTRVSALMMLYLVLESARHRPPAATAALMGSRLPRLLLATVPTRPRRIRTKGLSDQRGSSLSLSTTTSAR